MDKHVALDFPACVCKGRDTSHRRQGPVPKLFQQVSVQLAVSLGALRRSIRILTIPRPDTRADLMIHEATCSYHE